LASNEGSVESLNVSRRHGCTPYRRHARAIVACPIRNSAASSLVDQCVTPSRCGGGSSVAAMIAASSIVFGRPDRSASPSPARPAAAYRSRHWITVGRDTPSRREIDDVPSPSPAANTIFARADTPARTDDDRVQLSSVVRSSSRICTQPVDSAMPHHDALILPI
jgi:hypothetical protein